MKPGDEVVDQVSA